MLRQTPNMLPHLALKLDEVKHSSANKLITQAILCRANTLIPVTADEIHSQCGHLIAKAQHEVCIQFYKFFGTSDGGVEIINGLRVLHAKASREEPNKPIRINILLNARGKVAQKLYKQNNSTGLEELAAELNNDFFQIKVAYHFTGAFGTFHTKMLIVDGAIGMLLSGDPASPNDYMRFQFETATISMGSNVHYMRVDFAKSWSRCKDNKWENLPDLELDEKSQGDIPCIFVSKRENGFLANPKYCGCESPYKIAMLEAISLAKNNIKIMTPNCNDSQICQALAAACNRGVNVQIITGKYHNELAERYWGGTNFDTMVTLVKQVDPAHYKNLNIKWATNEEKQIVKHGETHTMHGKYACIDNKLVFVGSTPLDKQAFYHSREADLIFEDDKQAQVFNKKMFNEKFLFGKDYFVDCYDILVNQIEKQIKRLSKVEGEFSINARKKAAKLREGLQYIAEKVDDPNVENAAKPNMLLNVMLPILNIHTNNKCNTSKKTTSYKIIKSIADKFGIAVSTSVIMQEKVEVKLHTPELATSQEIKKEVKIPEDITIESPSDLSTHSKLRRHS